MHIAVKNKDIFPGEVRELLQALHSVGFFEESMLIGSWVMPLYQELFGINIPFGLWTSILQSNSFIQAGIEKKISKNLSPISDISPSSCSLAFAGLPVKISLLNLSSTGKAKEMMTLCQSRDGILLLLPFLLLISF